ncbi:hypothetical protein AB1Y20_022350 [Prymnesium parvum]|uniref:Chalcone isomerase domain-containing protein n=1 Tax=Prymnesium parvum TaxID=97485 RepID=A0AB34JJA0_PRYPA
MLRCLVLLAAPLALCRVEPSTGIDFPEKRSGQSLVGVGVRKKGPIKVYGVGMYVDSLSSKLSMSKFKSTALDKVDDAFYKACVEGGFGKTLVLKMKLGVSREKMAGAIAESVKPRMTGDKGAVSKLEESLLTGCEKFAVDGRAGAGTEFSFAMRGGNMGVSVNGKDVTTIKSQALCHALLNCYLDGKTVSPALKATCAEGILASL